MAFLEILEEQQTRENWFGEAYETRTKNDQCRVSGKNRVLDNREEYTRQWSEYLEENCAYAFS